MKLKIYGSGCAKCKLLTEHTEAAAQALEINYVLEKVTDMNGIRRRDNAHTRIGGGW